ncbi:hypothetical protein LTR17_001646 [Elasticomyces elasticus]|nr:hypothetical protein LTR17_001646 [Elasticomyces elasticus]
MTTTPTRPNIILIKRSSRNQNVVGLGNGGREGDEDGMVGLEDGGFGDGGLRNGGYNDDRRYYENEGVMEGGLGARDEGVMEGGPGEDEGVIEGGLGENGGGRGHERVELDEDMSTEVDGLHSRNTSHLLYEQSIQKHGWKLDELFNDMFAPCSLEAHLLQYLEQQREAMI